MARVLSPSGIPLTTPAASTAVRSTATAFGAPQAQAVDELGRGMQSLGMATQRLADSRKGIEDTAFLDRADLELDLAYGRITNDSQAKARSGAEGMTDTVRERLETETPDILGRLRTEGGYRPSDEAMNKVKSLILRRQHEHLKSAAAYEHNERIRFIGEQLDNSIVQIAHGGATTGKIGDALTRAEQSIAAYEGILPPAELATMRDRAATHFYNQMSANIDPEVALEYSRKLTQAEKPTQGQGAATNISSAGLDFIKGEEGYTSTAKWDVRQHSVGYGTRGEAGETITKAEAEKRLKAEAGKVSSFISKNVTVPLSQQQFDALVSFGFNLGTDDIAKLLPDINAGDFNRAAQRMLSFNKALNERTGELQELTGLTNRRKREAALFAGGATTLVDSSVRGALARTLSEKGPELVKAAEAARERRIDAERAVQILSGTLPVDPGSDDDRKTIDKAFRHSPFLGQLNAGDWEASDQLAQLASRISYVPKEAFETLRGMSVNGDPTQRHFAYQTLGRIMRERPGALQAGGGKSFTKDVADEVETFNTLVADVGLSAEQAIKRIDEMRSPEFMKRRESLKKEAGDIVKELTIEDITKEYSGLFTSRPAAGGSDRRANFMLDAYRDMVRYHYARTADPDLAKAVALNEMKRAYGVSEITGNKRLMRNRPEQFYPAIPSKATADPSHDYFTDDLKRSVREAAGKEIPLGDIYLESNSRTQADIAAGNPYPSYGVVWRQEDENGIPQLMSAPGPFRPDVDTAQKKASEMRRKAMEKERAEFAEGSERREEFRQRREEVAKDPMKIIENLKEDLLPDVLKQSQGEAPEEFKVSP